MSRGRTCVVVSILGGGTRAAARENFALSCSLKHPRRCLELDDLKAAEWGKKRITEGSMRRRAVVGALETAKRDM